MTVSPERLAGSALRRLHYRATRRHHNKVMVMGSSTTSANTSTDSNATALTSVTSDSRDLVSPVRDDAFLPPPVRVTANPLASPPTPPGRTTIVVQQPSVSLDYGGCATLLLRDERPRHARSQSVRAARRELLSPPPARARVASMPNAGDDDHYRLRHFSITGKGVVNRGDSLRSRSDTSVSSAGSDPRDEPYRVLVRGAPQVGKSSLVGQFMTSEYLHAYDTSIDDESGERSVRVLLAGRESELTFLDNPAASEVAAHGYCVVYSCADRGSLARAERELRALPAGPAAILVANKADLARSREVSTEEGKALATAYECKYIETSVGINHNVDELLVGLLTQIRLKQASDKRRRPPRRPRGRARSPPAPAPAPLSAASTPRKRSRLSASVKVRGLLTRVWAREHVSRSCENLHVL